MSGLRKPRNRGPKGPIGLTGAAGVAGATSLSSATPFFQEPIDADDVFPIPGPAGVAGAAGVAGGAGAPGAPGAAGVAGLMGLPGLDGIDGEDAIAPFGWPAFGVTTVTSGVTGALNDYAPGLGKFTVEHWSGAADAAFTGLRGGVAGSIYVFKNIGAGPVARFTHQSGASAAGNKYLNPITSAPLPVALGGYLVAAHDGTNWNVIGHEQGQFITDTYNGANFAADAGTWTVDAGDVSTLRWKIIGTAIYVEWVLLATSTSTTPTFLKIGNGAYGGFTARAAQVLQTSVIYSDAGGSLTPAFAETGVGVAAAQIFIAKTGGLTWGVNTNTLYVYGGLMFDVT